MRRLGQLQNAVEADLVVREKLACETGRQEKAAGEVVSLQFDRRILCKIGARHMRATALEDLLGVPWKEPMPQLMGNGEIFKSLIAVLGREIGRASCRERVCQYV